MLGWEFPPLLSGGLGVATYGMVKALSPLSSIRLIIPTAGPLNNLSQVNVIGLNHVERHLLNLEKIDFHIDFQNTEVQQVGIAISPYHHINELFEGNSWELFTQSSNPDKVVEAIHSIFSGREVYGMDIMRKVYLFAHLANELAGDGDFDIIHAHDWVTYPAAALIKSKTGKPLVLHCHALETDRAGEETRNEIYHLEKKGFEQADKIIAVSHYTKNQITRHYQITEHKIEVVHNGIDPAETNREKHQLRDKLVVFLGRITQQKGPEFLLETAEKVSRVYPRVKFVVAGTGDQFAHVLETAAYKKLGNKFIFAGFLNKSKVNELLSMADVYFMPSVSEPFGLTALEAAQYKVPSVISSQSGAAEVITASLKADFWDTDKYANYIHALLKYKTLGNELTSKASQQLENLTWGHAAEKIMRTYEDLINR